MLKTWVSPVVMPTEVPPNFIMRVSMSLPGGRKTETRDFASRFLELGTIK
jgi:hypothetical protein